MVSKGHALSREELVRTLTAYSGITTHDGAENGTTLIDTNLKDRNDFITEKTILIMSGDAKDEDKGALSFVSGTGVITLQGTGFSAQIKAGTVYRVLNISTVEMDVANIKSDLTDIKGHTALCITQWGGFEEEILLKAAADPAALAAATKFTPALPTGATVWKAYLVMKFREIYCAAGNYVATLGYVQVEKSSGGSWVSGITIRAGTLDVAAGVSAPGDCLIGDADVSAEVASGSEVEFQLATLRSNADDLALRDVQFGLQIYFTL